MTEPTTTAVELEYLTDDCGRCSAFYVRGHISDEDFAEVWAGWHTEPPATPVVREWWRWRPASPAETYEQGWGHAQMHAKPHARGAFPVTVVWR